MAPIETPDELTREDRHVRTAVRSKEADEREVGQPKILEELTHCGGTSADPLAVAAAPMQSNARRVSDS